MSGGTIAGEQARQERTVLLDVRDSVLRLALEHVGVAAGYTPVENGAAAVHRVTDYLSGGSGSVCVVAAPPTPLGARLALGAVWTGRVHALIAADDPESLPSTMESVRNGITSVPASLLGLARSLPQLTIRQHRILACLARGEVKDGTIAARLSTSAATVKRELVALYERLPAPSRHDLADRARRLGYEGDFALDLRWLSTMPGPAALADWQPVASRPSENFR